MNLLNFKHLINDSSLKVVGFDFFDTVMCRKVPRPIDIFLHIGRSLQKNNNFKTSLSPLRFQSLRIEAETLARQKVNCNEVTLQEIYQEFPSDFFKIPLNEVCQLEIKVEKQFLFFDKEILDSIEYARKKKKKVIIVSDTYFDKSTLREFVGDNIQHVEFFTSAEFRTGKSQNLFPSIFNQLGINPTEYLHIGDNYTSDFITPKKLGAKSFFYNNGNSTLWNNISAELDLINKDFIDPNLFPEGDFGITSLRCKGSSGDIHADRLTHHRYGFQYLGPVLTSFTDWIRCELIEGEFNAAFALMREGYLIEKMLSKYKGVDISIAYLSRRVLFQANLQRVSEESLRELRFGNLNATVNQFLDLICLLPIDVPELKALGSNSIHDEPTFEKVVNSVLANNILKKKIESRVKEIRIGVIAHIKNLYKLDKRKVNKIAVIDVGWNGTIQRLLTKLLKSEGYDISTVGLYMMTTPHVNSLTFENVIAKGFFIDNGNPIETFKALLHSLEIIEQSCAPPHGSVLKHNAFDGSPILQVDSISESQRQEIYEIQKGVLDFQNLYISQIETSMSSEKIYRIGKFILPILIRATLMPTSDEVLLFEDWSHDDNLSATTSKPILGSEDWQISSKYKTLNNIWSENNSDVYWKSGALSYENQSRQALLGKAVINNIPLTVFEENTKIDSMFITSKDLFIDKNENTTFIPAPIINNETGYCHLHFTCDVSEKHSLIWIPMERPFELLIDHMIFTFKSYEGRELKKIIRNTEELIRNSSTNEVDLVSKDIWRSNNKVGGNFIFKNIFNHISPQEGTLKVEIACKSIRSINPNENVTDNSHQFAVEKNSTILDGHGNIDTFNNTKVPPKKNKLISKNGEITLSGWFLGDPAEHFNGDTYLRVTNVIGHSNYIYMQTTSRKDVIDHFENEAIENCGFTLPLTRVSPGDYLISIIKINKNKIMVSTNTWELAVD